MVANTIGHYPIDTGHADCFHGWIRAGTLDVSVFLRKSFAHSIGHLSLLP